MQHQRQIIKNEEGVAAVELALIAPAFFLLMIGIVEVFLIMLAQNVMESSTFAASRGGKTGYMMVSKTREETILEILKQQAGSLLDTSKVTINSKSYAEFSNIGQPEPFVDANGNGVRDLNENYTDVNANGQYDTDMGSLGPGAAGQIVVYTVNYPWPIFTPMMQQFFGTNGILNLSARTVVRNEPY
jgi:Flp pilus assembly protein TadG